MHLPHASIRTGVDPQLPGEIDTHLKGRWLLLSRSVWVMLVLLTLGIFIAGLPIYYSQLQFACIGNTACYLNGALTPAGVHALHELGISPRGYAVYTIALYIIMSLVWIIVGLLIFWRRSDDWMTLFVALFLVTYYPGTQGGPAYALALAHPAWSLPVNFVGLLVLISLGLFLCLFPDGRFVPRWTRWIIVLAIAWLVPSIFFPGSLLNSDNWPPLLESAVVLGFLGSLLFAQVYRYRRVSNTIQRRQTKWVVFGGTLTIVGVLVLELSHLLLFRQRGSLYELFSNTAYPLVLLPIPLSIGIAILHSRLWDIDVLINRALVYSILTGTLALVFTGSIIVLQFILTGFILTGFNGQASDVAIICSTLGIRVLFQPLRHRIQAFIDRRFYRSKYDAARTLAAFSATLLKETDLAQLSEQLVEVVQETMQPAHVSLWLRRPGQDAKRNMNDWVAYFPAAQQAVSKRT